MDVTEAHASLAVEGQEFKYWHCHILAVPIWVPCLTSQSFCGVIHKTGILKYNFMSVDNEKVPSPVYNTY